MRLKGWQLVLVLCGLVIPLLVRPVLSPPSQTKADIVVLAEDLRNAGILGVVIGIEEACETLGWELTIFDVSTSNLSKSREGIVEGYRHVATQRPDGLIFVGHVSQPDDAETRVRIDHLQIPTVGWHVAPLPGPVPDSPVQVNVTTPSQAVAEAAVSLVVPDPKEPEAGVVIFTDTSIPFARDKSDRMLTALESCDRCTILAVEDISLWETAALVPPAVRRLRATYGARWTHSLAINDLYFDYAIRELLASNMPPPMNISAGDGSPSALLRIRYQSFQYASVAEPLLQQGWQLVDELHRIFHHQSPSQYVNPAYVVTQETVTQVVSNDGFMEPDFPYREDYLQRWRRVSDEHKK